MTGNNRAFFAPLAMFAGALALVSNLNVAWAASDDLPVPPTQFVLDLGLGAMAKPKFPGADRFGVSPFPIIKVKRFYVPGLGQVVDGESSNRGFFFYPSFDFQNSRKASDAPFLTGTRQVDWALELGAGAGYRHDWISGFAELRQGINGHEGQVAEFGIDVTVNPIDRVELEFGPRASWASDDYMDTYFGVTAAEAAAPGAVLTAYNPSAGFKTVGLSASAQYAWTDKTIFHLRGGWDRFVGDAADSPIVQAGSRDQFSIGLGMSYRFAFDLFD